MAARPSDQPGMMAGIGPPAAVLRSGCGGRSDLHLARHRRNGEAAHGPELLGVRDALVLQVPVSIHVFVVRDVQPWDRTGPRLSASEGLSLVRQRRDTTARPLLDTDVVAGNHPVDDRI